MISYTATDLIRQAKVMANMLNVNMPNFDIATTLLNTEYQRIYDEVVHANGASIKTVTMDLEPFVIPEDCYHIIGVYRNGYLLSRCSVKQEIADQYTIENNIIKARGPITVKYSTLPQTITAPDSPILLELDDVESVGLVTDSGFYYKDSDDNEKYYDFSSETTEDKAFKDASSRFLDHTLTLDDGVITYGDEDVTYIFERDNTTIKSLRVSDPYAIVNYDDNRSFIFYGFEGADQLNWYEARGKETYGEVLGFTTNDITGKGCIWRNLDGEIYYTSYTPDTVLNYPSNTFFQLLIYRLAATLSSLNGVQNQYLIENLIPNAEVAFNEHLAKDNITSIRMNNDI